MKLQTQIPLIQQSDNLMDHQSSLLLLGSCFVENIGEKLSYFKFQNIKNPLGILFHPRAIESLISKALDNRDFTENDLFYLNEMWHCFEAHSKFSSPSKEDLLKNLNNQIQITNQQLSKATHVIITLGTAWVYRYLESDKIVANCHKIPQRRFTKELLPVDAIIESLKNIVNLIHNANPYASIIFTVSPVRHIKDGFIENTQSKAHLITAIHQIIPDHSFKDHKSLSYFPSYEIMMDELRDYRFYAEDMLHPNQTGIDYIWERFLSVWMSSEACKTMELIDTIQKALNHKPFHPHSKAHQEFLQKLKISQLEVQKKYTNISF